MRLAWLSLFIFLSACVTRGEYEEVTRERDELEASKRTLEDRITMLEAERNRLLRRAEQAEKQAKAFDKEKLKAKVAEARAQLGLADGQELSARIVTTEGSITCELWPDVAPKTVGNFVGLSEGTTEWKDRSGNKTMRPLYDGTIFHRIIPNFMVQGGDPLGTGRGGPGYRFEDEVHPDVTFDQVGLLAMANSGPGTNGSQFFITDSKPSHLNGKHTIFGKCGDKEVLKRIIGAPVTDKRSNRPVDPVSIQRIEIVRQ